ncbi:hypothetical protein Tco_1450851, partial [Tanacetum coccineum]
GRIVRIKRLLNDVGVTTALMDINDAHQISAAGIKVTTVGVKVTTA